MTTTTATTTTATTTSYHVIRREEAKAPFVWMWFAEVASGSSFVTCHFFLEIKGAVAPRRRKSLSICLLYAVPRIEEANSSRIIMSFYSVLKGRYSFKCWPLEREREKAWTTTSAKSCLFFAYTAQLVTEATRKKSRTISVGFVDDVFYLAKPGGGSRWKAIRTFLLLLLSWGHHLIFLSFFSTIVSFLPHLVTTNQPSHTTAPSKGNDQKSSRICNKWQRTDEWTTTLLRGKQKESN